jgi:hypothetical protein
MKTIYVIKGGGQRIRQNTECGIATEYLVLEDLNYVRNFYCSGKDSFTNDIWSEHFVDIQRWADDWAGEEVKLVEAIDE